MRFRTIVCGLAFLAVVGGAAAQLSVPSAGAIPRKDANHFWLARNRICVSVWVNDSGPYPFLLDTTLGHCVIDRRLAARFGAAAQSTERFQVTDPNGNLVNAEMVNVQSLRFAERPLKCPTVLSMDLSGFLKQLGQRVDGILACTQVMDGLALDFASGALGHASGVGVDPSRDLYTVPLHVAQEGPPMVEALVNQKHLRRFAVDLSLGDLVAIPRTTAQELGLLSAATPQLVLGLEEENEAVTKWQSYFRLRSLKVGAIEILSPVCRIDDAGETPRLGIGFLQHFQTTFDFAGGYLRLVSDAVMTLRDGYIEGYGLALGDREDGYWCVRVARDSPADRAGILPGGQLIAIDGASMQDKPHAVVMRHLAKPEGGKGRVTIQRGVSRADYDLIAERLL